MSTPHIPEAFIRHIWQEQRFTTSRLTTSDGLSIQILSPGAPNSDAGPDFLGARIRIGDITYVGDVEIHQDARAWQAHGHHEDPHYNRVILHVVITADPVGPPAQTAALRNIPLLILHPYLDPLLDTAWTEETTGTTGASLRTIPCGTHNDHVPGAVIQLWIRKMSRERTEWRIRRMEERLKQLIDEQKTVVREPFPRYYGDPSEIPQPKHEYSLRDFAIRSNWEQLMYEGVMEALGYAKNRGPFLRLARAMKLRLLQQEAGNDQSLRLALLLGAAGLLPSSRDLPEKESRVYVRHLRSLWRRHRSCFRGPVLQEGDWLFFRLRPVNFPTARLAAIAHLLPTLFGQEGFRRVMGIFKSDSLSSHERLHALCALFRFQADAYWARHYHFRGDNATKGVSIGRDRITDILTNVFIPAALLYARIFRDHGIAKHAWGLFEDLPDSQDNSITRLMRAQLVKEKVPMNSAQAQQGVLHTFKFFCSHGRCSDCAVGKVTFPAGSP